MRRTAWTMASTWPARALVAGAFVVMAASPLRADPAGAMARTAEEAARVARVTAPTGDFTTPEPFEDRPAGAATAFVRPGPGAFSRPAPNLPEALGLDFALGEALFEKIWVSAPASTKASDGLGPLYNARACSACHVNDGRGHPPEGPGAASVSAVLHLSAPAPEHGPMAAVPGWHATAPEPRYGAQLQGFAVVGLAAEGRLSVDWVEEKVRLADGAEVALRRPVVTLADLAAGPLAPDAMTSLRVAPPMIGLGLIEAIPAADILAGADPQDADGDGISGRANMAYAPSLGRVTLGRFGLKAGHATVADQSASAFAHDLGISSPLAPLPWGDCTPAQSACRDAPHGVDAERDGFEIDAEGLALVTLYASNLAVPARRAPDDPQVLHGKRLFHEAGCAACHRPKFVTARLPGPSARSFQLIWPYSDFLLHDMGEGLADHRPEGLATGREWRTPPLWGIGLTKAVTGRENYLHDGRARSLLEAVLWHGGEAGPARDAVARMPKADRDALIRFLESL